MTDLTSGLLVKDFLRAVSEVHRSGAGTAETSHYPALNSLLSGLGGLSQPKRGALSAPKGIDGDYPDVALYEMRSNVLVLPVEAKGLDRDITKLAKSAQAKRYAKTFGGGKVLVTNYASFALAEVDAHSDKLILIDRVDLVADLDEFSKARPEPLPNAGERLSGMIEAACAVRGSIRKPQRVAQLLAYHGRLMMEEILSSESPATLLAPIETSFRTGLDMKLEENMLVPTTVQTLVYGLFAAWLDDEDPHGFEWIGASYGLSLPVYADMVHAILTPKFVRECNLPARLEAAARMLSWVDRDAFQSAFSGGAIEYFFEPFLAEFDEHLRDKLGVWYTPAPVADYQVAKVQHHLENDLQIAAGFASSSEDVYVLDPACGTGTYIIAVLKAVRDYHLANGQPAIVASQRAAEAARTRVIGFEILPAAFVIAHININRVLRDWGVPLQKDERVRVYLTNALTGWQAGQEPPLMPLEDLEAEVRQALEVKGTEPVIVIIGNPPYEGFSAAESAAERELLRPWMESLYDDYGVRKHRLGDLYVRFWRVAIQKIAVLSDRGIVCFITNRKWLGGRSFPLMRESLCLSFNEVLVDDLHGEAHEGVYGDESVFKTKTAGGIRVGAAIVTAVRSDGQKVSSSSPAKVGRRDIYGSSASKHHRLTEWAQEPGALLSAEDGYANVEVSRLTRWKLTSSSLSDAPTLDEYMPRMFSGVQILRDDALTDESRSVLADRIGDFFDSSISDEELKKKHPAFFVKRVGYDASKVRAARLAKGAFDEDHLVRLAYKPMSNRAFFWDTTPGLVHRARPELWPHWTPDTAQNALVVAQTARRPGAVRPFVSAAVPAFSSMDPDARVFPRVLVEPTLGQTGTQGDQLDGIGTAVDPSGETKMVSGLTPDWISAGRKAGLTGTDIDVGDVLFYALVAVMNSPDWVASQGQQLDDFPSVPLPLDLLALQEAAKTGRRVSLLMDVDSPVEGVDSGAIEPALQGIGVPTDLSDSVTLSQGRYGQFGGAYDAPLGLIRWDAAADGGGGWSGVPEQVWRFNIGGYSVVAKHLAYMVGKSLSASARLSVMNLCRRIVALEQLSDACNAAYEASTYGRLELRSSESTQADLWVPVS